MTAFEGGRGPAGGLVNFPHHRVATPHTNAPPGAGRLFMRLLLVSLGILFAASIVGHVVIHWSAEAAARDATRTQVPGWLWLSTAVLLASGLSMQAAVWAARADERRRLGSWMSVTTLLGLAFVAVQAVAWLEILPALSLREPGIGAPRESVHAVQILFLTGLHAAHVLGGLVGLGWVTARALLGHYSAAWHPGVGYCASYWHFLGVIWLVLFAVLLVTL